MNHIIVFKPEPNAKRFSRAFTIIQGEGNDEQTQRDFYEKCMKNEPSLIFNDHRFKNVFVKDKLVKVTVIVEYDYE